MVRALVEIVVTMGIEGSGSPNPALVVGTTRAAVVVTTAAVVAGGAESDWSTSGSLAEPDIDTRLLWPREHRAY